MKLIAALACLLISGCATMTDSQKKWAAVGTFIVAGAIVASQTDHHSDDGRVPTPGNPCEANPEACR